MKVKWAKFSTGRYKITHESVDGVCTYPDPPGDPAPREIMIDPRIKGERLLETLIHEGMHAEGEPDEGWVEPAAHHIARLLWRYGYRLTEPEDE